MFMRPPYELDPEVVWLQIDAGSNKGVRRMLQRYGGSRLRFVGLICQPPQAHGQTMLYGCDVQHVRAAADTVTERMFGAILLRDGEAKFLSLENSL